MPWLYFWRQYYSDVPSWLIMLHFGNVVEIICPSINHTRIFWEREMDRVLENYEWWREIERMYTRVENRVRAETMITAWNVWISLDNFRVAFHIQKETNHYLTLIQLWYNVNSGTHWLNLLSKICLVLDFWQEEVREVYK